MSFEVTIARPARVVVRRGHERDHVAEQTYSTRQVCLITGATYRQLDYWCRTGMIPTQPRGSATGSGNRRRWREHELHRVRMLRIASHIRHASLGDVLALLEQAEIMQPIEAKLTALERAR